MGPELMANMRSQASRFGADLLTVRVSRVDFTERPFKIWVGDPAAATPTYLARSVIIATGAQSLMLNLPAEQRLIGHGLSTCATCDGFFFRGQHIAVVGGGDSAVEEATFLTRYASVLYLIHRRDDFRAQQVLKDRALSNPKIRTIWHTVVEEIGGREKVEWLRLKNLETGEESRLEVGGVFIYVGFQPNSRMFRDPIKTDALGFIVTDDKMETSLPGIFCAGDVRAQYVRQITNAVGDATTAAIAATRYIEALEDDPKLDDAALEARTEAALRATATQYP